MHWNPLNLSFKFGKLHKLKTGIKPVNFIKTIKGCTSACFKKVGKFGVFSVFWSLANFTLIIKIAV